MVEKRQSDEIELVRGNLDVFHASMIKVIADGILEIQREQKKIVTELKKLNKSFTKPPKDRKK